MADVSFYLLKSLSAKERYLFACKLIEKIYRSGRTCYVLTDSLEQSHAMDDLLWTFRAGSFIPHQLYHGELPTTETAILIGTITAPEHWKKIVINLASECPADFQQSERIIEILDGNAETKKLARNRYRHYQQSDAAITTHNIA
jgi:DNA polymerase-3 subunit chi